MKANNLKLDYDKIFLVSVHQLW